LLELYARPGAGLPRNASADPVLERIQSVGRITHVTAYHGNIVARAHELESDVITNEWIARTLANIDESLHREQTESAAAMASASADPSSSSKQHSTGVFSQHIRRATNEAARVELSLPARLELKRTKRPDVYNNPLSLLARDPLLCIVGVDEERLALLRRPEGMAATTTAPADWSLDMLRWLLTESHVAGEAETLGMVTAEGARTGGAPGTTTMAVLDRPLSIPMSPARREQTRELRTGTFGDGRFKGSTPAAAAIGEARPPRRRVAPPGEPLPSVPVPPPPPAAIVEEEELLPPEPSSSGPPMPDIDDLGALHADDAMEGLVFTGAPVAILPMPSPPSSPGPAPEAEFETPPPSSPAPELPFWDEAGNVETDMAVVAFDPPLPSPLFSVAPPRPSIMELPPLMRPTTEAFTSAVEASQFAAAVKDTTVLGQERHAARERKRPPTARPAAAVVAISLDDILIPSSPQLAAELSQEQDHEAVAQRLLRTAIIPFALSPAYLAEVQSFIGATFPYVLVAMMRKRLDSLMELVYAPERSAERLQSEWPRWFATSPSSDALYRNKLVPVSSDVWTLDARQRAAWFDLKFWQSVWLAERILEGDQSVSRRYESGGSTLTNLATRSAIRLLDLILAYPTAHIVPTQGQLTRHLRALGRRLEAQRVPGIEARKYQEQVDALSRTLTAKIQEAEQSESISAELQEWLRQPRYLGSATAVRTAKLQWDRAERGLAMPGLVEVLHEEVQRTEEGLNTSLLVHRALNERDILSRLEGYMRYVRTLEQETSLFGGLATPPTSLRRQMVRGDDTRLGALLRNLTTRESILDEGAEELDLLELPPLFDFAAELVNSREMRIATLRSLFTLDVVVEPESVPRAENPERWRQAMDANIARLASLFSLLLTVNPRTHAIRLEAAHIKTYEGLSPLQRLFSDRTCTKLAEVILDRPEGLSLQELLAGDPNLFENRGYHYAKTHMLSTFEKRNVAFLGALLLNLPSRRFPILARLPDPLSREPSRRDATLLELLTVASPVT
jgi:hypothetical protein